jgi:hypothetical protein
MHGKGIFAKREMILRRQIMVTLQKYKKKFEKLPSMRKSP